MVALDYGNIARSPLLWIVGVLIFGGLMFWWGSSKGQEWADSKYLQDREERTQRIAVYQAKAAELEMENGKLRQENEAKAEMLRQADTAAEAKRAAEFQRLRDEREKKYDEIQNADPDTSIAGLCDDAKRAGYPLSFCR